MNLFGYERVLPPPKNLPSEVISCYITDNEKNESLAKTLGWNLVKLTNEFETLTDKLQRRICVAKIKCFPKLFVPEVDNFDFVFICDSNIISLRSDFESFMNSCTQEKCLFVTSGFYSGRRDNINKELEASSQPRWLYNIESMRECTQRYIKELTEKNIDINSLSVVSGKYLGWNLRHSSYEKISNKIFDERNLNLQGNIILTYIKGLYPNDVQDFHTEPWARSNLSKHNFYA
jgi:hypothetical protein